MPIILINPEVELRGETEVGVEGCLSFPEITGDIERAQGVLVRALSLEGEMFQIEASGLLSRAIQHEHDHLHGILFIDRMSSAAKAALSSRLKRLQKETRRGIRHHDEVVSETVLSTIGDATQVRRRMIALRCWNYRARSGCKKEMSAYGPVRFLVLCSLISD